MPLFHTNALTAVLLNPPPSAASLLYLVLFGFEGYSCQNTLQPVPIIPNLIWSGNCCLEIFHPEKFPWGLKAESFGEVWTHFPFNEAGSLNGRRFSWLSITPPPPTLCIYFTWANIFIGPESDHCLPLSLTHSLTNSLLFSKLYWCDPGVWRCQLKTCLCCNCCWWW